MVSRGHPADFTRNGPGHAVKGLDLAEGGL